jgi:hypothetical protein
MMGCTQCTILAFVEGYVNAPLLITTNKYHIISALVVQHAIEARM